MSNRLDHDPTTIDRVTSAHVCRGIGERLRQIMTVDTSPLPQHLQSLLDELQRREAKAALSVVGTH